MLKNISNFQLNLLKSVNSLHQQVRTTFVLKRRYEPLLNKKNAAPRKLRAKYFIYDLVEDKNLKRKPDLEVVLTTFVEGVGDKGDVLSLRPNFAYNKLLLPGLAEYKTPENVAKYAKTDAEKTVVLHSSAHAQRTVNMLERLSLAVVMNKDHPWVIEPWHIRASLRKAGYHCLDDKCIEIPSEPIEGPDLKKQDKVFYCTVTVNNLEKARVKCRIHHWSTDPSERLPFVVDFWKIDPEPLFGSSTTSTSEENVNEKSDNK